MALVLKRIYQGYYFIFEDLADPRSEEYALMKRPFEPALICVAYLYFVFKLGPQLMKDRPAFQLKGVLIAFNAIQIFLNAYVLFSGIHMLPSVSWVCEPIDYSDGEMSRTQLTLCHQYFLIKLTDLLDTVFFILKKNFRQVSFLHVYHHFGMVVVTWLGVKFLPGGQGLFIGLFNLIVHIFMYAYYLLTAWDSKYKKNVTLKKSLTQMQLLQFAILLVMYGGMLFQPNCKYPKLPLFFLLPQQLFMVILFSDFYYKTYIKQKPNNSSNKINGSNCENKTS